MPGIGMQLSTRPGLFVVKMSSILDFLVGKDTIWVKPVSKKDIKSGYKKRKGSYYHLQNYYSS